MRFSYRVLTASTLTAALMAAITAIDGCGTADCNDTATCPVGDDSSLSERAVEANSDVANMGDGLADAGDGGASATDAADDDDDENDVDVVPADGQGDAGDATVDVDMSDSQPESGPPDSSDAGVDAPVDAPLCRSNLLVAKIAVASSTHGTDVAPNVIDGNFTTRWDSAHGVDPQWIYLDLGSRVFFNRVRIQWETACGANYDIQTSNDVASWTTIQSIVGNMLSNGGPTNWNGAADHMGLVGFGRYLRINGTVRCGMIDTYGYSIWEMQVYGDTNATCLP
jgi:F5/8 type C domain